MPGRKRQAAAEPESEEEREDSEEEHDQPSGGPIVRRNGQGGGGACTSISKLAISGIRAFSPHREQAIEFYKPLTMIVGANGCGKTTIIECLKYVCTGTPPPGGDKGKSFVHDPKIAGLPEVKASIKLRFNDRAGTEMVVVRALQLTQKKTQSTFKTLDGVIKSTDEHGNRNSMSHKCGELDKQVPFLMGVSKAIMDNVIFCHQEESSWPLGDPASLKKKFDDIFESSRYSKALESIRKTKLDYNNKAKEMKIDLASLDAYREQADVIQNDIDKTKSKLESNDKKDKRIKEELAAVDKELEAHQLHSQKVREKKLLIEKKKSDLALMNARLKDKISTTEITGETEEELNSSLALMRSEEAQAATGLTELERKKQKALAKRLEHQDKLNSLNVKIGSLESEEFRENAELTELVELASRLSQTHSLTDLGDKSHSKFMEKVELLGTGLDGKEDDLQMALIEAESKYETDVQAFRDEVNEAQKNVLELESTKKQVDSDLKKAESEEQVVLESIAGTMAQYKQASRVIKVYKVERDNAEEKLKNSKDKNDEELKRIEDQIKQYDAEYKDLSAELVQYRDHLEIVGQRASEGTKIEEMVNSIEDKIAAKTSEADASKAKYKRYLPEGIDTSSQEVLRQQRITMKSCVLSEQTTLKGLNDEKTKVEKLVVQEETRRDQCDTSAKEVEAEIAALNGQDGLKLQLQSLNEAAWSLKQESEETIATTQQKFTDGTLPALLDFVRAEKTTIAIEEVGGDSQGEINYIKRLLKKAQTSFVKHGRAKCGCCDRFFSEESEYEAFKERLTKVVNSEADEANENDLASLGKEWLNIEEKAIALQAKFATKEDLENRLLNLHTSKSDHVAELRVLSKNIAAIVKKEKDQEAKLQIAQKADEIVSEICSEMIRLLDDKKQWEEKQMKFDAPTFSFSSNLPNNLTKLTAEMTEKENRRERCLEKSNELKEAREKIKSTREKNEAIFRNANDAHIKNEQTIKIYTDLDEKKKSLEEQIGKLNKTKESLQAQISPMEDQLCEAKANCAGLTTTWKADEVKLRKAHSEILKDVHEYHRLRDMARTFDSRKTTQKRQAAEADAEKAKESIATYSAKLQEIEGKLLQIQHVQAEKELIVSKLEANLTIIALRRDKDECEEELSKLQEAVKAMSTGSGTFEHTYQECEDNKQILLQERAELKGKMGAMQRQLNELEHRLKEPNYRGVTERTRKKRVELETTNMAVEDLEKYWGALDKALLRFHGQKISDINRIIRELWQRTYCGEDIDGIEIVSGEEGGSTRAARSYNYRVVMRKGNTALDMRGRCSAGQRVLACIVIRLALAETFCVSCGILTLDEPTTNLDEYNKSGLAASLADIISTRSKQRNFQLIVITHDGDFVNHMRDAFNTLGADRCFNLPEYYWRICRNQTGANGQYCSEIHRTDWDDM